MTKQLYEWYSLSVRPTGWLLLWWWAVIVFMLLIEDQLYYCNGKSTVLLEDRLYYRKINYRWKINCCVGRSAVLLEDKLYYWKINSVIGRPVVFSEDQLYWRQSTGIDGNYRSRKITARRWLHKYVRAECGASSFTWYLYQMCITDICPSVCLFKHRNVSVHGWRHPTTSIKTTTSQPSCQD